MAAVTEVNVRPALWKPEDVQIGKAAADLDVGDPVVIDSDAVADPRYPCTYEAAASQSFVHGVVIKAGKAGGPVEVLLTGELDGYAGLTPGAPLSVVDGAIDDTAPAVEYTDSGTDTVTVNPTPQLYAISATRIRVRI